MKTELIYSRNDHEAIQAAVEEIQAFRRAYLPVIRPSFGDGSGPVRVIYNRLLLTLFPGRFKSLQDSDNALSSLQDQLSELGKLVQISNLMQSTYAKYNGKMDIRVKPDGKNRFKLSVTTGGYSDDIGHSGSVRIPPINRDFRLSSKAIDKCFARGVIDFSWIDDELNAISKDISGLQASMVSEGVRSMMPRAPLSLPMFNDRGDNPKDILE